MRIQEFKYKDVYNYEEIEKLLRGSIFHVTKKTNFKQIQEDGFIFATKRPMNSCSGGSYSRINNCVSLFDFRNADDKIIKKTSEDYGFYHLTWFEEGFEDRVEHNQAYILMKPIISEALIDNSAVHSTNPLQKAVPKTEVWFKGDLPTSLIDQVFFVKYIRHFKNMSPHELAVRSVHKKKVNFQT